MYQVMGIRVILIVAGVLSIVVSLIWSLMSPPSSVVSLFSVILKSVSIGATVIVFSGQALPIVPWMARKSITRKYFPSFLPDLDGHWRAKVISNWPVIAAANGLPSPSEGVTYADVKITVRLFTIRMELDSDTEYSESETVAVSILRNSEHGDVSLHYVYDDRTPEALPTDSGAHFGAANLKFKLKAGRLPFLDGHYWTNRNWEKGLNTAGRVTMWRPNDPASDALH